MVTDNNLHYRVEDSTSVTLAPAGGASHTGGNSIIDKGLKDFFDPLKLED